MIDRMPFWATDALTQVNHLLSDKALLRGIATQGLYIAVVLGLLALFGPKLRRGLDQRLAARAQGPSFQLLAALARVTPWILALLAFWFGRLAFHDAALHARFLHLAESLALAWVIIRFTSSLVRNHAVAQAIALAAWAFAALNILGLIDPTLDLLDSMSVNIGHFRLSLLLLLKSVVLLALTIWIANLASRVLEHRLQTIPTVAPATQVLVAKLSKVVLLTLAVVIALNAVGIDLTAFAVLSGAIGVGIGFGLQKVVSNLISGVILLLDRSIKPGDVIEIAGTYGWITRLNARFVSVSTRDGIEHLIPNEDRITQRVTNWSYSDDRVRLHVPVGIGYSSDVRHAMALCIAATKDVSRVLPTPVPICLLKGFGDNSIDLELRFWIRDPRNGTANVRSEVMLGIWDRFKEHGIQLPFPQRDIHLPEMDALVEKFRAVSGHMTDGAVEAPPQPSDNGAGL
jgi:small-conductance mechanosensitive channel